MTTMFNFDENMSFGSLTLFMGRLNITHLQSINMHTKATDPNTCTYFEMMSHY